MGNRIECVTGRVTRGDNQRPVHGLLMDAWVSFNDAWDDNPTCCFKLGCDLSNRDGSFSIAVEVDKLDPACTCKNDPEIFIKVRDRDGHVIHSTRQPTQTCQRDDPFDFHIVLDARVLERHYSRPLSWTPPKEPLIPPSVIEEISEAIELLAEPGKPGHAAHLKAVVCAEPSISAFNLILRDAWETLQGDRNAAARYREILEALCGKGGQPCCDGDQGAYAEAIDRIFAEDCGTDPCRPVKIPKEAPCCERAGEPPCPCKDELIPKEKVSILLMAALHIAGGHRESAKSYLLVIINQICRFEFLGALHRAAVRALCGDAQALAHFRDLVGFMGSTCQAQDYPRPVFPARDALSCCETCLSPKLEHCLRDTYHNWCARRGYLVTEINPARACPGEKIVICGCGFGDKPGRVVFKAGGTLQQGPIVEAESWRDDQICVIVPQGAGCGLTLQLPAETVNVCDRFLEFHPTGCVEQDFEGTSPEILRFAVKDHVANECLLPGEPLRIRWKTCAADRVKIEVLNAQTGQAIATLDPADPRGKWDFTQTNFIVTTHVMVKITAQGKCHPDTAVQSITFVYQKPAKLAIDGLEITQAIQYYKAASHLTDAADRGADNSLRLVTNKTAWVRVYLRSGQDPGFDNGQVPQVDGVLTVERRVNNVWGVVATVPSQNGPVIAEDAFASYDTERGNINNTLNFIVPANIMTGLLRFRAKVSSPFVKCGDGQDSTTRLVNVNLRQTLNAAFIAIGYNGPNATNTGNLNLPAPSLAQCQAETSWAMTTYPVSGVPNVRIAGTFITNTPLNDPRSCPGCCSPNWQPLLQQVAILVAADQAANPGNWVYYGIINGGIPVNVPGCNGWGATGGLAGRPVTYAHEIGHQFGLPHARCGNVGGGNAAYPVYEPYDLPADPPSTTTWTMASIGEYGLDINNGNIANPNDAEDFMSYCGPRWISLYTHQFLVNAPGLVPQVIPTGDGSGEVRAISDAETNEFAHDSKSVAPFVHILGVIDEQGAVNVSSVARIETRYLVGDGRQTDYFAQLLDDDGRILAQDVLYAYEDEGGRSGCDQSPHPDCKGGRRVLFKAMLRDSGPGAVLRIVKCDETRWERKRPSKPPSLSKVRAALDKDNQLKLSWALKCESEYGEDVWVRWSNDNGKRWHALSVGLSGGSATMMLDQLPGGDISFQVLAHDGFFTVSESSNVVTIAPRPPVVSILYPSETHRVYADKLVHLWGVVTSRSDDVVDDERCVWYIDGKEVGKGCDIWVETPGAGKHEARLVVSDKYGEASATATITVR